MATDSVRRYNVSDAEMLSEARNFTSQLSKHLADFTAFDPQTFTTESVDEHSNTIKEAEELPTDNVLIDIMANSTKTVTKTLEICYDEISYTKYYVKKIFKDNKPVMNQFGYNDLSAIRKNSDKMIRFMEDFVGVISTYETQLSEAGYPAGKKDELAALRDQLKSQRDTQITLKKERPIQTAIRVAKLNEVWSNMTKISEAANILFKDNAELRNVFTLPTHTSYSKSEVDDESIVAE